MARLHAWLRVFEFRQPIQKLLVCLGFLHYYGWPAVYRENYRPLRFVELGYKITRVSFEVRQGVDVLTDVEHDDPTHIVALDLMRAATGAHHYHLRFNLKTSLSAVGPTPAPEGWGLPFLISAQVPDDENDESIWARAGRRHYQFVADYGFHLPRNNFMSQFFPAFRFRLPGWVLVTPRVYSDDTDELLRG